MILERLKVFENLIEEFGIIAMPLEKYEYSRQLEFIKADLNKFIVKGDWDALTALFDDIEEEIRCLERIIDDRMKEFEFLPFRAVFLRKLEELNGLIKQIPNDTIESQDKRKIALRIKNNLVDIIMQPEELKYMIDAMHRIDGEMDAIIGFVNFKAKEVCND